MAMAANRLGEIEGGFVVVADGEVQAEISLPIAGLMSLEPHETVREKLVTLRQAAWIWHGAGGAIPAGGLPDIAGDSTSEDHRFWCVRC